MIHKLELPHERRLRKLKERLSSSFIVNGMNSQKELERLYHEIKNCRICPNVNSQKELRKIEKTNIKSKVMIIAEAMAPSQAIVSGVNYFGKDGKIGSTGKRLEKFLNKFGYSVYPENPNCVYSTEIVHCFIRKPSKLEIINCLNKKFVEMEIELVKPKIILLMGKISYETFYKYFLNKDTSLNLTDKISRICETNKFDIYNNIAVIPIQHASGENPNFLKMLNNTKITDIIKRILNHIGRGRLE